MKLTALKIENLTKPGRYADGGGLYLNISKNHTKSWLFRYQIDGKRRWMGMGTYDKKSNTLAMARNRILEKQTEVNRKEDPIDLRESNKRDKREFEKQIAKESLMKSMTFQSCAQTYIETMEAEWSNEKHRNQWALAPYNMYI